MNKKAKSPLFRRPLFLMGGIVALLILVSVVIILKKNSSNGSIGSYNVKTVMFRQSNPSVSKSPEPGIFIDTNTKLSGFFGGEVTTSKPYSIAFNYTDSAFTYSTLEFTSIKVTYDSGIVETSTNDLEIPILINARKYECINSVAGGKIVKTNVNIFPGKIPGIITQDEAFNILIKGKFTKKDGTEVPFTLNQHYNVEKVNTTKAWQDVIAD